MCFLKRLLVLTSIALLLGVQALYAQVSKGGTPPSFINLQQTVSSVQQTAQQLADTLPVLDFPVSFDIDQLKAEDEINQNYGWPVRLGVSIPANDLNMLTKGQWSELPDGRRICRLAIRAKGAIALSVYYKEFRLAKGASLYIYNKERTHVIGAFTDENNPAGGVFATEYTAGDEFIMEYVAPAPEKTAATPPAKFKSPLLMVPTTMAGEASSRIIIADIGYAYSDKVVVRKKDPSIIPSVNESGSCMVNINCSEGEDWQREKNGIARLVIFIGGGQFFCSGSLVHNTAKDFTPYVITAYHCFADANATDILKTLFYFHYEQPTCSNSSLEPASKTIAGGTRLLSIPIKDNSDGALLVMNERVPIDWDLYWNGWDRRNIPMEKGATLHHPAGDVMKISTVPIAAENGTWPETKEYPRGGQNAHWMVKFAQTLHGYSTVQGGSSGSGLFNQEHRLVGTLTGGNANCDAPTQDTYYGKLWWHWDQSTDTTQRVKKYLDPIGSGAEYMDGEFLTGNKSANFTVMETEVYASEAVHFLDLSYGAESWYWEFPGAVPATSTERNPVVTYTTPGVYSAKLIVNQGTADELSREKNAVIIVRQKTQPCPAEIFTLGTGTEKAVFPLGLTKLQQYSAAVYQRTEMNRSGLIDSLAWNAGSGVSAPRNLRIYLKEVDAPTLTPASWNDAINGAVLVYENNTLTTTSGWNKFKLQTPFMYTATRHLMVLVATQADEAGSVSSDCYYSVVADGHMQWESAVSGPVSGNGTVNDHRPNIRIFFAAGTCGRVPEAKVQMLGNPFYEQAFDNYEFPPNNWIVTKPGAAPSQWILGNILSNPFIPDNGGQSKASAVVVPDPRPLDTWLISEALALPAAVSTIQFYVGFNGYKTAELPLVFYISTDNKATWKEIWRTPSAYMDWSWIKVVGNMSQYAGQTVHFAWRAYGDGGGDYIGLDQIQLFEDLDRLSVYEGDVVYFTDKSSGPPVHRSWSLPGATPASSTEESFKAVYNDQGVYDVTLNVQNNLGTAQARLQDVITVTARKPMARFHANGGYTRFTNYGRFIPVGGSLHYRDSSLHVPKQWAWEFEGGAPATGSAKNMNVTYPTSGVYGTRLTVTNVHSSDDTLVDAYVKAGGMDKIWNMKLGDRGVSNYTYGEEGDGYLAGTCIIKTDKFAEEFSAPQVPISLSSVDVRFFVNGPKKAGEKVTLEIYNTSTRMQGGPFKRLASVDIPIADINPDGYTTINLPEPLTLSGIYYVAISGFSTLKTQLSVATSEISYYSTNSAYAYHLDTWYTMPSYAGSGIGVALNIVPSITYLYMEVGPQTSYSKAFDDTTSVQLTVRSNERWTVTTEQPWIRLDKQAASGDTALNFKCFANADNKDRHGVIVLNLGDVLYKRIYVTQTTGDSIVDLSAQLMTSDYASVDLKWGSALIASTPKVAAMAMAAPAGKSKQVFTGVQPGMEDITLLSGSAPYGPSEVLRWHDNTYARQFYYNGAKQFRIASLFYPEDMSQYHGGALDVIEFYPNGPGDFRLMLYQDEVLVLDSVLTHVQAKMYNRIDISRYGLQADATKSLRIVLDILAPALSGVASLDAGPAVEGKGNLIMNNVATGIWAPLSDFDGFETAGNWMISAYVKMKNPAGSYYRIYRNNQLIQETDKSSYIDQRLIVAGTHCYRVSKVSTVNNVEGKKSNEACVLIKPVLVAAALGVSQDYGWPLPTPEDLSKITAWDFGAVNAKITKQPTLSVRSDIQATSPAGVYPGGIQIEGLEVENQQNYNIRYVSAPFTHRPRPILISDAAGTQKAYGDPDPASIPYTVDMLVPGESLAGELTRKAGEGVGEYPVELGTLTSENNPNYKVSISSDMRFKVVPRPIIIVPDNSVKAYGDQDPLSLPYTVTNLLSSEGLNGQLMREPGENVGEYAIMQGQLDNLRNPNYDISFKTGRKFLITPRTLTIIPDAAGKSYGEVDPVITYKVENALGAMNMQGGLSRVQGESSGQYAIILGSLSGGVNYNLSLRPSVFNILPASLFVQADNLSIAAGSLLPHPTYTMQGYLAADEADLRGILDNAIYIDADSKPDAGVYKILFDSYFTHKNYKATFAPGQLTVTARPVSAFIPGSSDSRNATFMPEGAVYLQVFSGNGVLVYEGSKPWDGNTKQAKAAAGIYYYVAKQADGTLLKGSVEVYNL